MGTANTSPKYLHALGILELADQLKWQPAERLLDPESGSTKFKVPSARLLYHLIKESHQFNGQVLNRFWELLGSCNEVLKQNMDILEEERFLSAQASFEAFLRGLDPDNVKFDPVIDMATEFFIHLGVAFLNPGRRKSGTSSQSSVSEVIDVATDELLEEIEKVPEVGKRKQELLKGLCFRRDGGSCLLTRAVFLPSDIDHVVPELARIIPHSVYEKIETQKCIAMFAGSTALDELLQNLNSLGNVMNMQVDAHRAFDCFHWGIEATGEGEQVKYIYRRIPTPPVASQPGPGFISLRDGDEIQFGKGPEGEKLRKGPIPKICNLQLAVSRAFRMSGAADIILAWKDETDDEGCYPLSAASEEYCGMFCDVLDAKLFLTGRAAVT